MGYFGGVDDGVCVVKECVVLLYVSGRLQSVKGASNDPIATSRDREGESKRGDGGEGGG